MFDIFKRKKPNTLTSSHQPTLVVDNYAHYTSFPKSSSQVDENYDSLSSGSSTLVGDSYAQYASMPKSSSQVDENYAPMPSVPFHLRRKIRDYKESVPTPREQYLMSGGKIISKYPQGLPRPPFQDVSLRVVEKRLGEVPDRFHASHHETSPIKEEIMYAPIEAHPSAEEFTGNWVRVYKNHIHIQNKKLREEYLGEEASIPRVKKMFHKKVNNGEEPDRTGDQIFGRLSINEKCTRKLDTSSIYDSGFLMVNNSNDFRMQIPYYQGKTQTMKSRYNPGPVPLNKTYDTHMAVLSILKDNLRYQSLYQWRRAG